MHASKSSHPRPPGTRALPRSEGLATSAPEPARAHICTASTHSTPSTQRCGRGLPAAAGACRSYDAARFGEAKTDFPVDALEKVAERRTNKQINQINAPANAPTESAELSAGASSSERGDATAAHGLP